MPDPNIPVAPTQNFNFDNVPGADMSFDDLFGSPTEGETSVTSQTTATNGEPSQPVVAPPVPPEPVVRPEFAIDAGSSKYKTVEDATKGIREKDTLIENLRQQYIARTGVDPVTQRPVMQQSQPVEKNYLNDPAQFTKDLRAAVESGDDAAYAQAQLKLLYDALNPVAPLINGYARQNAMEAVSKEITEFQSFRQSDDFKQVLDKNPLLGQAINTAEGDYRLHGQLPELYRVAYWAGQGLKTPDLIKAAQAQAQAQNVVAQSQPPARTPMQGSTLAPPTSSGQALTVSTHEGRKAIIAEFERNGVLNTKF